MKTSFFKNDLMKSTFLILLLFTILLFFSFEESFSKKSSKNPFDEIGKNSFYQPLSKKYVALIFNSPIDSVLGANQEIRNVKKQIKFDAHILEEKLYRELVLIRKKAKKSSSQTKTIKFNIYPVYQEFTKDNYTTVQSNVVSYFYDGENYEVVRQVIPNIAVAKIVCYTQQWQTLIGKVDNSMISPKDSRHISRAIQDKKDSLSIGLDTETSAYGYLFRKRLEDRSIPFLSISENLRKEDFREGTSALKKYLSKNELQLLQISNDIDFWQQLTHKREVPKLNFLNLDEESIQKTLKKYIDRSSSFANTFDIEKLAEYYALLNLYSGRLESSLYLNLNTQTGLLEPYFVSKKLGELNTYLKDLNIKDSEFLEKYSLVLQKSLNLEKTENLIEKDKNSLRKILEAQQHIEPSNLFDEKLFEHNKLIIEKGMSPSTTLKIALSEHDENRLEVEIENLTNFPVLISELSHKQTKFIASPQKKEMTIMPSEKVKVTFDLPDSYDNLFVHKKKKTTGFILEKDIFDLFVGYQLAGTNVIKYNAITPFKTMENLNQDKDLFRLEHDFSMFDFIVVDEVEKTITFKSDSIVLKSPLQFPSGYVVNANTGLSIDIVDGGKIISKSPLNFKGSEEKPIRIYSSDNKGQGIFVVSVKETSEVEHVEFENLTNQEHGLWHLTGAVVFYESPVNLDYVLIANNSCEDGLNIIRTHFTMNNTKFMNTQSDAFDGDFVKGTLTNCTFENLGNDAIDVSGSKLEMYDIKISKAGDKALSAGEDSQMKVERIAIDNCEIAIAGKDLSTVQINDASITSSKLGFTAFKKKPEFGGSNIIADNVRMNQVETSYLIENKSSLVLNGKQAETIKEVKEQMYGVEFGVDSKETRVKKTQ